MTPYIIEERQLNISQLDVFKIDDGQNHLLGRIDDQIANIVQAQLLFLESADASKDIQIYLNSWRKCLCRIRDL
jgi:ATP-dependent Clp protease protease subunit